MTVSSGIHLGVAIHVYRLHVPLIMLIKELFGVGNILHGSVLQVKDNKARLTASHYLMFKFKLGKNC